MHKMWRNRHCGPTVEHKLNTTFAAAAQYSCQNPDTADIFLFSNRLLTFRPTYTLKRTLPLSMGKCTVDSSPGGTAVYLSASASRRRAVRDAGGRQGRYSWSSVEYHFVLAKVATALWCTVLPLRFVTRNGSVYQPGTPPLDKLNSPDRTSKASHDSKASLDSNDFSADSGSINHLQQVGARTRRDRAPAK